MQYAHRRTPQDNPVQQERGPCMFRKLNVALVPLLLSPAYGHVSGTYFHYAEGVASDENEVWAEERGVTDDFC
jgi:hypothetical protein